MQHGSISGPLEQGQSSFHCEGAKEYGPKWPQHRQTIGPYVMNCLESPCGNFLKNVLNAEDSIRREY